MGGIFISRLLCFKLTSLENGVRKVGRGMRKECQLYTRRATMASFLCCIECTCSCFIPMQALVHKTEIQPAHLEWLWIMD